MVPKFCLCQRIKKMNHTLGNGHDGNKSKNENEWPQRQTGTKHQESKQANQQHRDGTEKKYADEDGVFTKELEDGVHGECWEYLVAG
jgi:hypothetical protein